MIKDQIANTISKQTNVEKPEALQIIEEFMEVIKNSLSDGENVYLRGFGTFFIKYRAEKAARLISEDKPIIVPAHNI